ncbi:uncharacterized protein UTRI_00706_B [Ustilago trichophora]|uniref:Uncharacterized protein n=1 Tax=Ustilago trichophora TaxID=86804 RepID=A0A5C3DSC6_9BASI|nr:uncharacterized protein UTRI_00706_B [Ustilago trichophora]
MVLQNKYKAKASRRYNSAKGSTEDGNEASSSKPGYRHRFAKKHHGHAPGSRSRRDDADGGSSGSGSGDDDEGDAISGSDEDEEDNAEFPSLAKAAATSDPTQAPEADDDPSNPSRGKYARRRLGESKLARLERLEAAKDPRLPDDEEPEPEVDISQLVARVAALGDSAGTQAGMAAEIARSRGQNETASDVENDIDHSLAYLHEKERQRQKAKGQGAPDESRRVTFEQQDVVDAEGNAIDLAALQKEKEKAEAVRALKARFQGHGVGERSRPDGKLPRSIPSIHIGPNGSGTASPSATPAAATGTLSDSLTAEIESSLAASRSRTSETGSVNSGRSSFSTTFGRRKSPLAGIVNPAAAESESGGGSSSHRTERIDSFLASLNNRSVAGRDPSVFTLSPAGSNGGSRPSAQPRTNSQQHGSHSTRQQQPIHSTRGELGRLESFLDDMLG